MGLYLPSPFKYCQAQVQVLISKYQIQILSEKGKGIAMQLQCIGPYRSSMTLMTFEEHP